MQCDNEQDNFNFDQFIGVLNNEMMEKEDPNSSNQSKVEAMGSEETDNFNYDAYIETDYNESDADSDDYRKVYNLC